MAGTSYDAIVIGAGVAGLGVAAQLQLKGLKTALLERDTYVGGRATTGVFKDGWKVDYGQHGICPARGGNVDDLVRRVGKEILWQGKAEGLDVFKDGKWYELMDLVKTPDTRPEFKKIIEIIVQMKDEEIGSLDHVSWAEWIGMQTSFAVVQDVYYFLGMIATTIQNPVEQAASEVIWIIRQGLQRNRELLPTSHPSEGSIGMVNPLKESFLENGGDLLLGTAVNDILIENNRVRGVRVIGSNQGIFFDGLTVPPTREYASKIVVCTVPLWELENVLNFDFLPEWWVQRVGNIKHQTTAAFGYILGLSRPLYEGMRFKTSLKLPRCGAAFEGFPSSSWAPETVPEGKMLFYAGCPAEPSLVSGKWQQEKMLHKLWLDINEMFPNISEIVEWKKELCYVGIDGLARKPGLVGQFKPDVKAPGVTCLYFAGDTYRGRGIGVNASAHSAMLCADRILMDLIIGFKC